MKMNTVFIILVLIIQAACAEKASSGMNGGKMISTVYYKPVINAEDPERCADGEEIQDVRTPEGDLILTMCASERKRCLMQGTCLIQLGGDELVINYSTRINDEYRFKVVSTAQCPYGYGVRGACLDPFYSVAADLKHFRYGDVIYVNILDGLLLPDGSHHNGYLIVRDAGGMIKGPHRFDLFTGYLHHLDSQNPFAGLGLADPKKRFHYRKVTGAEADSVRAARNFPRFPTAP